MTEDELDDMIVFAAQEWVYAGGTAEAVAAEALRRFPCVTDDWERQFFCWCRAPYLGQESA